jgi:aromatic ring-opening dioxygenase catalytic subunit (LigB family)
MNGMSILRVKQIIIFSTHVFPTISPICTICEKKKKIQKEYMKISEKQNN